MVNNSFAKSISLPVRFTFDSRVKSAIPSWPPKLKLFYFFKPPPPQNTNRRHSSIYVGVSRLANGKWRSQCYYDGRLHYVGRYDTELEAAYAINDHCLKVGITPKNPCLLKPAPPPKSKKRSRVKHLFFFSLLFPFPRRPIFVIKYLGYDGKFFFISPNWKNYPKKGTTFFVFRNFHLQSLVIFWWKKNFFFFIKKWLNSAVKISKNEKSCPLFGVFFFFSLGRG